MIECRVCKKLAPKADGASGRICRKCNLEYMRQYHAANKTALRLKEKARWQKRKNDPEYMAKNRKRGREYWQKLRHEAMMAYGGYRCKCCGETEPTFLSLDHINNDGAEHRRSLGYAQNGKGASSQIWKWLRDHGYPKGFQVLCMNCNHSKARNGGVCAHKAPQTNTA